MKNERVMNNIKAVLLEREEILPGVFRFLLHSPEISRDALPGQFVQLETDDGPFPVTRRPFTFNRCSPEKGQFEIVFDVVGRGTGIMSESREGDRLGVLGPLGNGYRPDPGKWLLVGGGMGAAGFPFLCRNVDVAVTCIHSSRVQVSTESNMGCGWGVCEGCVIPAAGGGYLKCCTDGPVFMGNDIDWKRWIEVIQG